MKIYVDADACPVVAIVEQIAKEYEIPVTLLCDTNHVLYSDYSEVVTVGAGADAGYIRKGNILLDYGCGKGRVDFFLSYQTRCKSIGIEYDERIYEKAAENKKDAVSSGRVEIELANAEEFAVPETADCMYFFNPFSVEILRKVMARILESYYAEPRRIQLFFYYPSDEYISYLMTVEELMFTDEIVCMDLFPGEDPREKIAIFELDYME